MNHFKRPSYHYFSSQTYTSVNTRNKTWIFFFFRIEKHLLNQNQILFYYLQANAELTLFKNEHNVQKKYAYIIKICQFYLLGAEQKSF